MKFNMEKSKKAAGIRIVILLKYDLNRGFYGFLKFPSQISTNKLYFIIIMLFITTLECLLC